MANPSRKGDIPTYSTFAVKERDAPMLKQNIETHRKAPTHALA